MSKSKVSRLRRAAIAAVLGVLALVFPPLVAGLHQGQAETTSVGVSTASPAGAYLAGRVAGNLRDAPAAAAYYRAALRDDPDNPSLLDRAFALSLVAGDMDDAMRLAWELVKVDPSHRLGRLALAVKSLRARQYAEARRHLESGGDGPLAELTNALLQAWTSRGMGDGRDAQNRVAELIGPEWYNVFKPYHSGLLAEVGGDQEAAARHFRTAFETDSGALRVVQAHARQLARAGRAEEAVEALNAFAGVVPRHPLTRAAVGEIEAGRVPPPIASTPQEGAAEVLYGIGSALGSDSGEEYAAVYLQLALYLAPGQPLALLSLANYYEQVDAHELAIATYEKIPETSPLRGNADIQRALNLNDLDRLDEARAVLDALIEDDPEYTEAIVALGNILRAREMFSEAADIYTLAVDRIETPAQTDWTLYYFRGICFERAKRWDHAEADLLQALALYPEQPHVLNYLGYSWVDQGVNLEEALDMIRRAVELRSNDGYIVDSLGWAYYRLGRYEEAVRELERAVELRPQDPVINDHLGDAYWRVGRRLEARFQWSHARDLEPEPENLEEILEKLESGLDEDADRAAAELREGG